MVGDHAKRGSGRAKKSATQKRTASVGAEKWLKVHRPPVLHAGCTAPPALHDGVFSVPGCATCCAAPAIRCCARLASAGPGDHRRDRNLSFWNDSETGDQQKSFFILFFESMPMRASGIPRANRMECLGLAFVVRVVLLVARWLC